VEAALGEITACGGRWVGLEVEADNRVARSLYEHLGFREAGRTVHLLRPAGLPRPGNQLLHHPLRRGHYGDGARLVELVHTMIPASHRQLLELYDRDYRPSWERSFDHWLDGRREFWWVVEEDGVVCGAVRALRDRRRYPDRLEVIIASGHEGRFETGLVRQGIDSLRGGSRKMIEAVLASPTVPLVKALEETGFQRDRVLVQMRLGSLAL